MTIDKLLKLNLGCGYDKRKGFVNIDADQKVKPDLVCDLTKKLPFPNTSVSEIIAQDVLEHLTKKEGAKLLKECGRVLVNNGKITIRIPDIPAILKKFRHQDDLIMLYLYGDTSQGETYTNHKYGYTTLLIKEACQKTGLKIDKIQKADTNILIEGHSARSLLARTQGDSLQIQITNSNPLLLILRTIIFLMQKREIIWEINKKYPPLISKLFLRPLSRKVSRISCTKETEKFVQDILKYSHLKTAIEDI